MQCLEQKIPREKSCCFGHRIVIIESNAVTQFSIHLVECFEMLQISGWVASETCLNAKLIARKIESLSVAAIETLQSDIAIELRFHNKLFTI